MKHKCSEGLCRHRKINMVITHVVRILLVAIFIRGIIENDHSQDFIIIITFLLTLYPYILEKKFGVYLPCRLQITITLFIFAAQYLGEMRGFYELIPWWDTILHTTSGVILGVIGFMFVYLFNEKGNKNMNLSPLFVVLVAFCFSMTMAVFWEFFEFSMDRLFELNMQKFRLDGQDGLVDTMIDLLVAMIGTIIASIGGYIYMKKKNDVLLKEYFDDWFKENKKDKMQNISTEKKILM